MYLPHGFDAVVHLEHNGADQDVHVTDAATTSLAPGQHVRVNRHVDVEATGGYGVYGTITYGFVPPSA